MNELNPAQTKATKFDKLLKVSENFQAEYSFARTLAEQSCQVFSRAAQNKCSRVRTMETLYELCLINVSKFCDDFKRLIVA